MKTTRTAPSSCPECNSQLDMASHPRDAQPAPGDLSVCAYCSALLQYRPDMSVEKADIDSLPIELRIEVRRYIQVLKTLPLRDSQGGS